jgi:hypothetical protein
MSATRFDCDEIERLVDRHIELCELFEERMPRGRRAAPLLVTMSGGKASSECLGDLVDRALVAYEGSGFSQDSTIYALKIALVQAIIDMS